MVALQTTARIIGDRKASKRNVTILSDSQAANKALSCNVMKPKKMYGYRRYLDEIAERYDIHIVWVPGHIGIPSKCRADELVRRGITIQLSDEYSYLGIPMRNCKLIINNAIVDSVNGMLAASDKGKTVERFVKSGPS